MSHRFKKPKPLASRPRSIILPDHNIRSLYKYFLELKYAEAFLDGEMLFRSLAYFRDNEDAVRGDEYEGTSKFLPDGGLVLHNQTQGTIITLPMAFESTVKAQEIFVYCVSQALRADIAKEFNAVACVEVTKIATLCARIRKALPVSAAFRARPVDYYPHTQGGNPRWALPDQIGTSKLARWASQNEYRFLFSVTDALGFEKVETRLIDRKNRLSPSRMSTSPAYSESDRSGTSAFCTIANAPARLSASSSLLIPDEVDQSWLSIKSEAAISVRPLLRLKALVPGHDL
jgi:hypothetical protein